MSAWTRRSVLRVGAAACAAAMLTAACASDEPEPPDPLEAPADRAARDAATITAAIAVFPDRAGALETMAAERRAHAEALTAEVERLRPAPTTTSSAVEPPAVEPPTLDDVRAGLIAAAEEAANLVPAVSGYRCGLLGSIAAACHTQVAIALP